MKTTEAPQPGSSAAPTCSAIPLPHHYAFSHEPTPRRLWDEDDMRQFAAAVLKDANDLCRSAMAIAEREGRDTSWEAFRARLGESLKRQHELLHPVPFELRWECACGRSGHGYPRMDHYPKKAVLIHLHGCDDCDPHGEDSHEFFDAHGVRVEIDSPNSPLSEP